MRLEEQVVNALLQKGQKICFAESCTGGLLGAAITAVPDSSAVFDGGVCSYANRIKNNLLGVSSTVLDTYGAVSASCAVQMAEGALALFAADIAVSVTGIAGPGGGTAEKPVGTVYICCLTVDGRRAVKRCRFTGDRATVRNKSKEVALRTALDMLTQNT